MSRRSNGEGTIFKRKDGRFSAQIYVTLANGAKKRVSITKKSKDAVKIKLREVQEQENRNLPYSDKDWTVAEYFDYWMKDVQTNRIRETTLDTYERIIARYLKPLLGNHKLQYLNVSHVRIALSAMQKAGCGGAVLQKFHQILSAGLNCAMSDEIIFRNVARLAGKPKYVPNETIIWNLGQVTQFIRVAKDHPQFIAFLFFFSYGMRRGEVLGIRYCDIDFDNNLVYVRQQIGRIRGEIKARDLKTANSRRTLPLTPLIRAAILHHAKMNNVDMPPFDPYFKLSTKGTILRSRSDTPLEPKNLERCFFLLTEKAGLPRITIHAMRHIAATALKDLEGVHVSIRDVQLILGHADPSTTMRIYQHGTPEVQRTALTAVGTHLLDVRHFDQIDSNVAGS
jgi:integrase